MPPGHRSTSGFCPHLRQATAGHWVPDRGMLLHPSQPGGEVATSGVRVRAAISDLAENRGGCHKLQMGFGRCSWVCRTALVTYLFRQELSCCEKSDGARASQPATQHTWSGGVQDNTFSNIGFLGLIGYLVDWFEGRLLSKWRTQAAYKSATRC